MAAITGELTLGGQRCLGGQTAGSGEQRSDVWRCWDTAAILVAAVDSMGDRLVALPYTR